LPGEHVRVIARGALGGTPLAVRVGTSTFALRRIEARCVQVALLPQPSQKSSRSNRMPLYSKLEPGNPRRATQGSESEG